MITNRSVIGFLLITFLALTMTFLSSCTPGTDMASSAIVGESLKDSADRISWALDRATANADYALEKNIRQFQLMADSLAFRLEKEMETNREFVSNELLLAATRLNELLENAQGGILPIQDFAVLDAQNLVDQIPFKKDLYLIRRVEGYGVMQKQKGTYDFIFIGNAFQPGRRIDVILNNVPVDPNNIVSDRLAHTLQFSVPVDVLNKSFTDDKVTRISVKISCYESDRRDPFYRYSGNLLLLPRFPVQYSIKEKFKEVRWTGPKDWKVYQREMGPTGKNEKWDRYTMVCEAPQGTRFTRKHKVNTSGSHSSIDAPQYISITKATVNCANQTHDAPRTATARLEYQQSEEHVTERSMTVQGDNTGKKLLRYGTHMVDLSPQSVTYTAEFTYFNGDKTVLHKQKLKDKGIRVSMEVSPSSDYKRLIIEIDDPLYN
jgi:hypothetical protein